jgi:uncharacterized membrane protein
MATIQRRKKFYGWRVVSAAFVVAIFGLGMGFHGPPIYLFAIREARGWSLPLVSTAVTVHFLTGALVAANLPALYRRFGIPWITKVGAMALGLGVFGWAIAEVPWQLYVAALLSGAGWVTMGVAAINSIVSPWFVRARPAALAVAYNGANIGGVIFAPLWVTSIAVLGFPGAAAAIGIVMIATMWVISDAVLSRSPEGMRLSPDGDAPDLPSFSITCPSAKPLPGRALWLDTKFVTLAAGMGLGLFAQIGMIAHLYSLLVPALGARPAGWAMGLSTAMAVVGGDRRLYAAGSCAFQILGTIIFICAAGSSIALLLIGVVVFGLAFGNGTWLPPLIAQVEFVEEDVQRVVALIVASSQAGYAFAPVCFGFIRQATANATGAPGDEPIFFAVAALVQGLAVIAFLIGRRRY